MTTTDKFLAGAQWYAQEFGWKILPCYGLDEYDKCTCGKIHTEIKDMGKHPVGEEWQHKATDDPTALASRWAEDPRYNVGVMCKRSGFFVLDIDPRNGGYESFDKFEAQVEGAIPPTVTAITGIYNNHGKQQRGRHLFFKVSDDEYLKGNLKADGLDGLDIKHNGYVLLAPSKHISGVSYEWAPGLGPHEIEMAEAPEELLAAIRRRGKGGGTGSVSYNLGAGEWGWVNDLDFKGEKVNVEKLLEEGIDEGSRAVDIYKMACALANKMGTDAIARQSIETLMMRFNHEKVRPPLELEGPGGLLSHVRRAIEFVASNPKTELAWGGHTEWEREALTKAAIKMSSPGVLPTPAPLPPVSTVGFSAPAATSDPDDAEGPEEMEPVVGSIGWDFSKSLSDGISVENATSGINVPHDVDALRSQEGGTPGKRTLTDTGNGRRLIDAFGAGMRYTPGLGWFLWNGQYWKPDIENLGTRELAKKIAPAIAAETIHYDNPEKKQQVIKWANESKSNARLDAAVKSGTSDPRIGVEVDYWDRHDTLLGVLNGVVDLKTGKLLQGRPDLHITRRSPVPYQEGLVSKRFQDFLDFGTGGDKDLQEWLQKAAGYTISGLRTYDVLFLMYGPSGSGKNTLIETLVKALGTKQYAWSLDPTILAAKDGQSNSTDLYHWAELRGRRMIWVDELPESERIKENQVKKLTGSSEITARSPGEKPFSFESKAKMWITTNHRPIITDEAMWRRIRPIPWDKVPTTPDPGLKQYLFDPEGGLPAVLAWAVEGARKLLNSTDIDALGWCSAVETAAEVYRKNEDRMGLFLDEETEEVAGAITPIKTLFNVYKQWSDDRTEKPMSQIAFQRKLEDRGVEMTGAGSRADVLGRKIKARAISGDIDWDLAARVARD